MSDRQPLIIQPDWIGQGLTESELMVIARLDSYWRNGHTAHPSDTFLSEQLGMTLRKVERLMASLERKGWITRSTEAYLGPRGGRSRNIEATEKVTRSVSDLDEDLEREGRSIDAFHWICEEYREELRFVGRLGDGEGGYIIEHLKDTGILDSSDRPAIKQKQKIPPVLRKRVFERDAYRCRMCGSWEDLCADHVFPESRGGETTEENLQTLCRPCNSAKGNRSA